MMKISMVTLCAVAWMTVCTVCGAPMTDGSNIFSTHAQTDADAGVGTAAVMGGAVERAMSVGMPAGYGGYDQRMGMYAAQQQYQYEQQQQDAMRAAVYGRAAAAATATQSVMRGPESFGAPRQMMMRPGYVNQAAPYYRNYVNNVDNVDSEYHSQADVVPASTSWSVKKKYESYLLTTKAVNKDKSCVSFSPWCCGYTTYIYATCGAAKMCAITLKSWGTYSYNVSNGKFTDLSDKYAFKITICNVGKEGVVFVSTF